MLFYVLTVSVFGIATFGLSPVAESNISMITCKRNSDDYSSCLKRALDETWWPQLLKGMPEFDVPPIDPLFAKYAKIIFNSNLMHAEAIISNLSAIGLAEASFSDIRTYFLDDVFRVEIDGQVPSMFVEAAVKINGVLSIFKVAAEGHLTVTANDIRGTCSLIGHVANDTWIVEHFRLLPLIGKFKVSFDNLLEGSKEFSDIVITFVNEYWPLVYRETMPFLFDRVDPLVVEFLNKFFSDVSFSKVFP
ncbi:PREDICTED: uncharacterized protein LOC105567806 [Vollenhovia emeryi]|uniref:uncharacterized protein LOC105567806 n=1 Tax=Vollenhovia emeryi TaxID=411798 RepID=UPI0005F4BD56|nr:PREDICTED: uncharacterized protein LOC105567806 [Vollenhovia emeryi]